MGTLQRLVFFWIPFKTQATERGALFFINHRVTCKVQLRHQWLFYPTTAATTWHRSAQRTAEPGALTFLGVDPFWVTEREINRKPTILAARFGTNPTGEQASMRTRVLLQEAASEVPTFHMPLLAVFQWPET